MVALTQGGEAYNRYNHFGKQFALACRVEHTNKQQLIPLLRIYPGNSCTCVKDVCKTVQRSVVCNSKTNENPDVRYQEKGLIVNCGLFPQYNKYYGAMKMNEL